MATRLKKIKVNEVSLVTKPAIAKEFLLYKSEEGASEVPIVEEITKTEEPVVETAAPVEPELTKAEEPPVVEVPPAEHAIDTQKAEEPVAKEVKCPTCGQEVDEEEAKKMKEGDSCKACQDKKKVKKEVEDISKALEQERIEKAALVARVEELEKAANEAKQAEITKAYIEKASVDLKHVPGVTAQTIGPILKSAADKLEKSEFEVLYEALKSASAFIKANSRLTKELGVGGEDLSADPAAQLDAIAKSYVQKDAKLTYAKAYSIACDQNPQIYAQHVRQARRE
jgi:DNA repair exonuclease SbcCD ATPase subunit